MLADYEQETGSLPAALVSATRAGVLSSDMSAIHHVRKVRDIPTPQPVAAGSGVPQSAPAPPPPPPALAP
jgi:hypothetical protein